MNMPFFRRIFWSYIFIAVVFLVVGGLLSVVEVQRYARVIQIRELVRVAESQVLAIEPLYTGKQTTTLSRFVAQQAARLTVRITVIDANGIVLADSDKKPQELLNHIARPEIQAALRGHSGSAVRLSESVGNEMIYVAVPLMRGTQVLGVMRVSVDIHDMRAYTQPFILVLFLCGLAFLVFVNFYAIIIARSMTEPLDELSMAAQEMSLGTLTARVHSRSSLLRDIGTTFNTMAEKLEQTIIQTKQQKQDLVVLVDTLPAGVLVVDKDSRVYLFNSAIQTIFEVAPVVGGHLWEFCRDMSVNDLVHAAQNGTYRTQDLQRGTKKYQVVSRAIPTGTLLLFQDVTDIRLLAEMKRDFVVNASHELRTPLTAIKGFSENLIDELTGETKHYAEIIYKNTERLINIVQDIMLLSELEISTDVLKRESVQLRQLIDDVVVLFGEKATAKHIQLTVTGAVDVRISGDQFKLQQVLINLIDNAIKYTDQGTVAITLSHDAAQATLTIKDSGIGIAQEYLPRLFERFYVVDKSRSRKTGGTGLGLAIVKHIVLLHNGTINVDSAVGVGTTITVTLPV